MDKRGLSYQRSALIFLSITAIVWVLQIIMATSFVKMVLANATPAVAVGLIVYTAEFLIVKIYLGDAKSLLWIPFKLNKVISGMVAFLAVFISASLCVRTFDQHRVYLDSPEFFKYLLIFLLNLVPSAMTEEWLFRFFPTVLVAHKSKMASILFYVSITVLFMLMHLPKYFFQGNVGGLLQVFMAGVGFLTIYHLTQNLPFVILIHAFTNNPWFVYESSSNWLFLYAAIILVSLTWGMFTYLSTNRPKESF
jgi:hypothetical protein